MAFTLGKRRFFRQLWLDGDGSPPLVRRTSNLAPDRRRRRRPSQARSLAGEDFLTTFPKSGLGNGGSARVRPGCVARGAEKERREREGGEGGTCVCASPGSRDGTPRGLAFRGARAGRSRAQACRRLCRRPRQRGTSARVSRIVRPGRCACGSTRREGVSRAGRKRE